MKYISVKEAARIWRISERRVRALCADGRIEGAERHGDWAWSIPQTASRPLDGRSLRFIRNQSFRTGAQNYEEADRRKGGPSSPQAPAGSALLGLSLDGAALDCRTVEAVLGGEAAGVPLPVAIEIRNAATILEDPPEEITESGARTLNRRILNSAFNGDRGRFAGLEERKRFATLALQLAKDWAPLHPVARAAFLFGEFLRIAPFVRANGLTAVCLLQTSLRLDGYPLALFQEGRIEEVKAALAASRIRGNFSELVSLVREALLP